MLSQESTNLLHLSLIQGIGPKTVQFLVKIFGNAEKVLNAIAQQELEKIGELSANSAKPSLLQRAARMSVRTRTGIDTGIWVSYHNVTMTVKNIHRC